ncbi:MAG: LON peptidase substrate-binding domain-containing protein, partial [Oscillospiraceae bacterium]
MREKRMVTQNQTLPMIALRGLVLFPKMVLHFDIGRDKSIAALNAAGENGRKVFLSAQRELADDDPAPKELYPVGVIAEIKQVIRVPGAGLRVMVEGLTRAKLIRFTQEEPYLMAEVRSLPMRRQPANSEDLVSALMRTVKNLFEEYASLSPKMPKELLLGAMLAEEPNALAEYIAGNVPLPIEEKQEILTES